MTRQDIIDFALVSDIQKKWHFFKYHFNFYLHGIEHPFAKSIVDCCFDIENKIPKAGKDYINKIAAINDKPKNIDHYDQLLQVLSELMVVHKVISYDWGNGNHLTYEPTSGKSNKNPEILVQNQNFSCGIEVKSPRFVEYHNKRSSLGQQIPSRSELIKIIDKDNTLLPRDNSIKDFLISANEKFSEFKKNIHNFFGILVIVWDDFIYEPISALINPNSGLLTDRTFALDSSGKPLIYPNIDCIIITRHLLNIVRGTREEPLVDYYEHPLDYGRDKEFPYKVYIKPSWVINEIPDLIINCFQVVESNKNLGAEYMPSDFIFWC